MMFWRCIVPLPSPFLDHFAQLCQLNVSACPCMMQYSIHTAMQQKLIKANVCSKHTIKVLAKIVIQSVQIGLRGRRICRWSRTTTACCRTSNSTTETTATATAGVSNSRCGTGNACAVQHIYYWWRTWEINSIQKRYRILGPHSAPLQSRLARRSQGWKLPEDEQCAYGRHRRGFVSKQVLHYCA